MGIQLKQGASGSVFSGPHRLLEDGNAGQPRGEETARSANCPVQLGCRESRCLDALARPPRYLFLVAGLAVSPACFRLLFQQECPAPRVPASFPSFCSALLVPVLVAQLQDPGFHSLVLTSTHLWSLYPHLLPPGHQPVQNVWPPLHSLSHLFLLLLTFS